MTDKFEQECRLLYEMSLKDSPLRLEYEEKVRALLDIGSDPYLLSFLFS